MNDNLTPDLQIAQLKQKGLKNKEIAALVFPDLPLNSAVVKVSRHLTKGQAGQYIEQTKTQALKKYDVTWDILVAKLITKINATRKDQTGDIIDDNNTQMSAIRLLIGLLDTKPDSDPTATPLNNLPKDIDEIQALRFIRNK